MAAQVPTSQHVANLPKLFQFIQRYDIDELLAAATRTTLQGWPVISIDEKGDIERREGGRKQKLDHLITLITESTERMTRFALFIKWYTSPIQEAADVLFRECQDALACVTEKPETVINSREKALVAEHFVSQKLKSFDDSSSAVPQRDRRAIQFVDHAGTANSQEQYSMESHDQDTLCSQVDNLSSGSQKSSDVGYSSGLSKELQSLNLSTGGECTSLLTLQSSLEMVKMLHLSRQKKQQKRSDVRKHHHKYVVHQPTVVVNQNTYYYHIPGKDEQQMKYHDQPWPPLLARHSGDIINSINMDMLLPHLIEKNLLTKSEYHELRTCSPWKQGEHFVLKVLPTKGEKGFKRFMECLEEEDEHSGHQDLFQLLESSIS